MHGVVMIPLAVFPFVFLILSDNTCPLNTVLLAAVSSTGSSLWGRRLPYKSHVLFVRDVSAKNATSVDP